MNIKTQYNEYFIEQDKSKRLLDLKRHVKLIRQYADAGDIGYYEIALSRYRIIRDDYKHKYNVYWFKDFSKHTKSDYDIADAWDTLRLIHDEN